MIDPRCKFWCPPHQCQMNHSAIAKIAKYVHTIIGNETDLLAAVSFARGRAIDHYCPTAAPSRLPKASTDARPPSRLPMWRRFQVSLGPVAVAIDASQPDFMSYTSGVYDNAACMSDKADLDHAVLAVGWGVRAV